jgi:hypothetical protein
MPGIAELKGRSVGLKLSPEDLLTLMAAQVGLDPVKDMLGYLAGAWRRGERRARVSRRVPS